MTVSSTRRAVWPSHLAVVHPEQHVVERPDGASDPREGARPERWCDEHGWIAHASIREAARAIAAVQLGIAFERVSVTLPNRTQTALDRRRIGGMRLRRSFVHLAKSSPLTAFQLVVAGALGEHVVLQDYVDAFWVADLTTFRAAVGCTRAGAHDELDLVIREDARAVTKDIIAWVGDNREPIECVASMLCGARSAQNPRMESRERWSLAEDEVVRLLG